jgi:hypothetical protein
VTTLIRNIAGMSKRFHNPGQGQKWKFRPQKNPDVKLRLGL